MNDRSDDDGLLVALTQFVTPAGWTVHGTTNDPWCRAAPPGDPVAPAQGWKLHLAATDATAKEVLRRAIPILLAAGTPFKITPTARHLAILNEGSAGFSQIGKFLTVYPPDEGVAVALAGDLDTALADLTGPVVPSDRRLRDGGIVSYRYGGFTGRWMQTAHGELTPALERPDGTLVPDTRLLRDAVPAWLDDPFEAAGLVQPPTPPPALVADRFRVLTTIYRSPRGSVHLAVDLRDLRRCVLKRAIVDDDPWGPAARLAHEHEMLERLSAVEGVVGVVGWVDDGAERVLAIDDIAGRTLMIEVNSRPETGFRLPPDMVTDVGIRLADIVAAIHADGVVHRDIKPTNVLREPDGALRLIDFELAWPAGDGAALGFGTVGYASPEQQRREAPHPADDVYALGATLYVAATGAEMSTRPVGGPLVHRVEALAPTVPPALAAVIERCLAPDRADRFAHAGEVRDALIGLGRVRPVLQPPYGAIAPVPADGARRALDHVLALADAMCADLVDAGPGAAWISRHPASPAMAVRDVNTGVAGGVLALARIATLTPEKRYIDALRRSAAWLDAAPRPEGAPLGGLYVGEGGVAAALMRAGLVLGDERLLESARRRSRFIAELPHGSPDLFNGSAGRARVHLWIAQTLGDDTALDAAKSAAAHLVGSAINGPTGDAWWELPPEVGGGTPLGYAHGAAGIADVLLDVAEATGDEPARATALAVARWLITQAFETDEGSVAWPSTPDGGPWAPLWCHGATGIGRFLLHVDRCDGLAESDRWLLAATGVAAARLGRALGPVVCHGLAGSIDHLLDLHQASPGDGHLAEAWSLAELLEDYHVEGDDGHLRCSSERPEICSPDLTVGYAGVAAVWLRLAHPDQTTLLAGRTAQMVTG